MIHATRGTVLNSLFAIHGLTALFGVLALAAGANAAETPTRRWALLIGVDKYQRAKALSYCGEDQRALAKQLEQNGFARERVVLLHDQAKDSKFQPFKANIETQLDLMLKLVKAGDVVVVGFSGHGKLVKNASYLCPTEGNLDEPATLISVDALSIKLDRSRATFKLVLVDACRDARRDENRGQGDDPRKLAAAFAAMRPPLPRCGRRPACCS